MGTELMSATEITKRFGIPRTTLYRLVEQGKIPAHDVTKIWHQRKHWRFDPAEVARALGQPEPPFYKT